MRSITLFLLLFFAELVQAQHITCTVLPENQKRKDCDITSVIPFEGGVLSVVLDKAGLNAKYNFQLCKISKDHKVQTNINTGFDPENWMRLIGLYQINGKPVIFYTLYTSRLKVLHIKAAVIDPATLKIVTVKEVKKLELESDDMSLIVTNDDDAQWVSPVKIELSQDSSRYLLVYHMSNVGLPNQFNQRIFYCVFDENADLLFDKIDVMPGRWGWILVKDHFLTKSGKILNVYQYSTNEPILRQPKSAYTTIVRSINISNSKASEVKFDKSFEFIRNCRFISKTKDNDNIELVGTYSKNWEEEDLTGAFQASYNNMDNKITVILKEPFPSTFKLTEIFPEYFSEKRKKGEDYRPLHARLRTVYSGLRENGSMDMTLEYTDIKLRGGGLAPRMGGRWEPYNTYNYLYLSCVNINFSDKKIIFTAIPKKQLAKEDWEESAASIFPMPFHDKLLIFYNDLRENFSNNNLNEFKPASKPDKALGVFIIGSDGNLSKNTVYTDFDKNVFPETKYFRTIDTKNIIFRVSDPEKRYKEFKLGFLSIE